MRESRSLPSLSTSRHQPRRAACSKAPARAGRAGIVCPGQNSATVYAKPPAPKRRKPEPEGVDAYTEACRSDSSTYAQSASLAVDAEVVVKPNRIRRSTQNRRGAALQLPPPPSSPPAEGPGGGARERTPLRHDKWSEGDVPDVAHRIRLGLKVSNGFRRLLCEHADTSASKSRLPAPCALGLLLDEESGIVAGGAAREYRVGEDAPSKSELALRAAARQQLARQRARVMTEPKLSHHRARIAADSQMAHRRVRVTTDQKMTREPAHTASEPQITHQRSRIEAEPHQTHLCAARRLAQEGKWELSLDEASLSVAAKPSALESHACQAKLYYHPVNHAPLALLEPIRSHPVQSHLTPSYPTPPHSIPSHLTPSHPIPSHPIPSNPIHSNPLQSTPIPSLPNQLQPNPTTPTLPNPVQPHRTLF